MAFDSIFPFLPSNAGSPPQLFPFDVIINTAFPGVEFIGTEPNQEYQEIREVNGSLWLVTNAMFNQNLLQWDQEVNQNTSLPAYAFELGADGSMTRWESPATLIPDTPITWRQLWVVTGVGLMDSTPLEVFGPSAPMNDLAVTWDPGIGVVLVAREVDLTDIASSPLSLLDNLVVNGVPVWSVDKTGFLVHGTVPASAVVGIFNNATFTGNSTFNGPATFNSSITGNSTLFMVGHTTLNGGLTVTGGESVTGGLSTDTLNVTGAGTTTFTNIHVTGTSQLDGNVHNGAGGPVVPITSPDNSISVVTVGNGYHIEESGSGLGSVVSTGANLVSPPSSTPLTLPGSVATSWNISMTAIVELTAPLAVGTVTITGVSTGPGWNGIFRTYTNPGTMFVTVMLEGVEDGGSVISANITATGGTISVFDFNMTAIRFL